jgi:elongation factor P--beta-lysine ligase
METIIDSILSQKDFISDDIPTIDLYMDQILTLFDEKLQQDKRYPEDKLVTKTMINNYSKAGLIQSVKGKKYTKEQILQMLLVYQLKNTISMQEIKTLVTPIYEQGISIQDIYDRFINIKQSENKDTKEAMYNMLQNTKLDSDKDVDRLLLIMYISSISQQLTRMIEMLLDTYYPK